MNLSLFTHNEFPLSTDNMNSSLSADSCSGEASHEFIALSDTLLLFVSCQILSRVRRADEDQLPRMKTAVGRVQLVAAAGADLYAPLFLPSVRSRTLFSPPLPLPPAPSYGMHSSLLFLIGAFNLVFYAHRNPERRREHRRLDHRHAPPRVRCRTVGVPRRSGRSRWVYNKSCGLTYAFSVVHESVDPHLLFQQDKTTCV